MLEQAIYHQPDSQYAYALTETKVALRLRTARSDVLQVCVLYGGKYDFARRRLRAPMRLSYTDRLYNYYTAELELADVRLVYVFCLTESGKTYYYSEDGLSETYSFELSFYNAFQMAYLNRADIHRSVSWLADARFYQIFVDRFARGNFIKDESYIDLPWGALPTPKSFAGGDLRGIAERLPYLRELGVNALYLTPVFKSVSNHKYDTEDYFSVDAMFGGETELASLVSRAHGEGFRIVLDAVFNHTSERCAQFCDVLAKGKNSEYFDWFVIDGDAVDRKKVNYACFASCAYMPKWNTSNPKVQEYLIGVALYWMRKYGIDGWRLDVSDEVSHDFWRKFRAAVKAENAECAIIGENWHGAQSYLRGDQYDSIMNYGFTKACLDLFAYGALNAQGFAEKLNELLMRNTDTVNGMMLNLLDSHDTHRFLTQVGGSVGKLECALAVLYMFVGVPCIYYGTEIGMEGGYDPDCRRTMNWERAARRGRLWRLVNGLARLKREESALRGTDVRIRAEGDVLIVERGKAGGLRLCVNCGAPVPLAENCVCTNAEGVLARDTFMIERTGEESK